MWNKLLFAAFFIAAALCMKAGFANSCSFVRVVNVNFGTFDPITSTSGVQAQGSITFQCTSTASVSVTLDTGLHAASCSPYRDMLGPTATSLLNYNLYQDAALTTIWGGGTGCTGYSSETVSAIGGQRQTIYVYGLVPYTTNNQNDLIGFYSDTVTVTINF